MLARSQLANPQHMLTAILPWTCPVVDMVALSYVTAVASVYEAQVPAAGRCDSSFALRIQYAFDT